MGNKKLTLNVIFSFGLAIIDIVVFNMRRAKRKRGGANMDNVDELFAEGRYDQIVSFFQGQAPQSEREYVLYGLSCYYLGLQNDAIGIFKDGLKAFPSSRDILFNLVECLFSLGMFDEVERYINRAIEIEPGNYAYYDILATLFFSKGDKANGLKYVMEAIAHAPNGISKELIDKYSAICEECSYAKKYGFFPPPSYTDMSGYEVLLDTIVRERIYLLEGDVVEIGAFLGGGTYKLSKLLEVLGVDKKVYTIDIFDPTFDTTMCTQRKAMAELYKGILGNLNQFEIYKEVTKNCKNVVTLICDSKKAVLPCNKICFSYIDGNHSPEYVRNDFYLVWDKTVPMGIVAFDDYGYDLPQVTKTIHKLIGEQSERIMRIWTVGGKRIFIQKE